MLYTMRKLYHSLKGVIDSYLFSFFRMAFCCSSLYVCCQPETPRAVAFTWYLICQFLNTIVERRGCLPSTRTTVRSDSSRSDKENHTTYRYTRYSTWYSRNRFSYK